MERVYAVTFMKYTDSSRNAVVDEDTNDVLIIGEPGICDSGPGSFVFLVKETDLKKYSRYGGGYESVCFRGYMGF